MKNNFLKLNHAAAVFCAIVFVSVLLNCQAHESLALICRLTVCQLPDSGVRLTVNRGWRGMAYTFPMTSSSLPPVSPSSFLPHMSVQVLTKLRIVGSLGTYGAERQQNEGWREKKGGVGKREREREREKLSGKCLSLSQQPEESNGQMDRCYFRLTKTECTNCRISGAHFLPHFLSSVLSFFYVDCICRHRNIPFIQSL